MEPSPRGGPGYRGLALAIIRLAQVGQCLAIATVVVAYPAFMASILANQYFLKKRIAQEAIVGWGEGASRFHDVDLQWLEWTSWRWPMLCGGLCESESFTSGADLRPCFMAVGGVDAGVLANLFLALILAEDERAIAKSIHSQDALLAKPAAKRQ